jgi:DNA primase
MSAAQISGELEALAARIARIGISRRNPDAFFELRSQAARDARLLADWLRRGRRPAEFQLADERTSDSQR